MTADDIDKAIQTAFQNFRADNCGRNPTHVFMTIAQESVLESAKQFRFSVAGDSPLHRQKYCGMDVIWTERDGPAVGILATNS